MLRLTGSERAVAEIAATAEHVTALTAAAAAFQLDPDVPDAPDFPGSAAVSLLDKVDSPEAAATLDEIEEWAVPALGIAHLPAIWRAFAHHPGMLAAVWRKNRLILGPGVLDEYVKGCAALAVFQFRQSRYWIAYQTQFLRHSFGFDDRAVVEATSMVMHSLAFNTIAHGMRLDPPFSDLSVADFETDGRLAQTPGPGSQKQSESESNGRQGAPGSPA